MKKSPFSDLLDPTLIETLDIRPEAAYLYDAVMLYVKAVNDLEDQGLNYKDGRQVTRALLGRSYQSALGYKVQMDDNGDVKGNYTLLYKKSLSSGLSGLFPIGRFYLNQSRSASELPFLKLNSEIPWPGPDQLPPRDEPPCGFHNEFCPPNNYYCDLLLGVLGGLLAVFLVVGGVVYRNWRYEQELDSLLWKIDFRELHLDSNLEDLGLRTNDSIRGGRNSQISLTSNNENDFSRFARNIRRVLSEIFKYF